MDASDVAASVVCPKCGTSVAADEKFCTKCGTGVTPDGVAVQPLFPPAFQSGAAEQLEKARKWLLAVSILTLISGFIFFAMQSQEVEKQLREAEAMIAHLEPGERDEVLKQEVGMTWDEIVAHDRGMVRMLLFVNIGLAIVYFALWLWAKKSALAATVIALMLFLTVIVVSAILEPTSLAQGVIVKIFFIVALAKAIAAASEERKLRAVTA